MKLAKWQSRVANWKNRSQAEKPMEHHLMHLHAEVSEAWDALQDWGTEKPTIWYDENLKPQGFGPELADVVLGVCYIAEVSHIDLEAMMEEVMSYKEGTREKK